MSGFLHDITQFFDAIVHLVRLIIWILTQPAFWIFVGMSFVKAVLFLAAKKMSFRDLSFSFSKMQHTERFVSDENYFGRIAGNIAEINAIFTGILLAVILPTNYANHLWFLPLILVLFGLETHAVATWWGRMVMKEHLRTNGGWKLNKVPTPAIWDLCVTWLWLFFELAIFVRWVLL